MSNFNTLTDGKFNTIIVKKNLTLPIYPTTNIIPINQANILYNSSDNSLYYGNGQTNSKILSTSNLVAGQGITITNDGTSSVISVNLASNDSVTEKKSLSLNSKDLSTNANNNDHVVQINSELQAPSYSQITFPSKERKITNHLTNNLFQSHFSPEIDYLKNKLHYPSGLFPLTVSNIFPQEESNDEHEIDEDKFRKINNPIDNFQIVPSSSDQVIYVRKNGDDNTGTGSISAPFSSISHAMNIIRNASWETRYIIDLGPGNWSDSFSWKAWVFIRGSINIATRLLGNIDINDISWASSKLHDDERAGGQNLNFTGIITLNFSLQNSQFGKFYFWNCNINSVLDITGVHFLNQVNILNGFIFADINIISTIVTATSVSGQAGNVTLTSSSVSSSFTAFGGSFQGTLNLIHESGQSITATLYNCSFFDINISGRQAILNATNSSLPFEANISISNGALLNRLSDAFGLEYTPENQDIWEVPQPTTVKNAIDRLANCLSYLVGGPIP